MQPIKFIFWLLPSILIPNYLSKDSDKNSVLFCYGKTKPETLKGYNYLFLEPLNYSKNDINLIRKSNKNVLAYISLGEVNSQAKHYKKLKNIVLGKNENWDSYYLDIKSKETQKILISLIDEAFEKGFEGMFLDNIDNYSQFGPQKTDKNELIEFIKLINKKYPNKIFIQNAGLEFLEKTHGLIDGVVVESVATNYSFLDKQYKLRNKAEFESYIKRINLLSDKFKMQFILVEYADNKLLYNKISNRLLKFKFKYFVGKIDLQTIPNFKK
ncbi:endo alpha-1,4 polygalactosaminidase [Flavobacterium macrobrachii]|jgi:polysaccharide biosynthesis protein PelA|uniref:endo alpha-1,4 polygalactosaminidase n=1 Tax=Flavobacterium macrobrachii TaxID=591204 RepID=UPI000DB83C01|nr:MAG: hypothetical protein DCF13_13760 [Flavobacteriaceae bacterium]